MPAKKKAVFNWSGGKDSALALLKILQDDSYEVVSLLTTISEATQSSTIHAIPLSLLQQQAHSIGIPLYIVSVDPILKNYADQMHAVVTHFKQSGVTHFIFGDIFLQDIKTYREKNLLPMGIEVVEPLWNKTSKEVIDEYLQSGIRATIIVTQADALDQSFIGRTLNAGTINDFPSHLDLCGENGEYHTFAYDGPIFRQPVAHCIQQVDQVTYDVPLDNGTTRSYTYWQATLSAAEDHF
jgi:uncharacterized protein (TIGR00290 family)